MEERIHGDTTEHRHEGYDYWHPVTRVHSESTKDQLPVGHVLSKKPLAEKLILDLVPVTPIQKMEIGKSLEIGAVQSLIEGLEYHRHAASSLIEQSFKDFDSGSSAHYGSLFYAEWQPNHNSITHRYLIEVIGEDVYVGYFPYDGRKPRLYGIHHKKMDVIKFLHKTNSPTVQVPELTLLTELNIPNIRFELSDVRPMYIHHKQGIFFTHSLYGEFIPLLEDVFFPGNAPKSVCAEGEQTTSRWEKHTDVTGFSMSDPKHPWYMFQGATGYVQLYEGKMFCYPDGSIRFLTKEQETAIERTWSDMSIIQGDLVEYDSFWNIPEIVKWADGKKDSSVRQPDIKSVTLDRHNIEADKYCLLIHSVVDEVNHPLFWESAHATAGDMIVVTKSCTLTITHPEHGETKHEAIKGEVLALLPGTSRPFQKDEAGD